MFVSTEIVAIVLSAVGILATQVVAMFAGFSWCIRRADGLETKLTTRIDGLETRLIARIDGVDEKLTARIDGVDEKLTARIDSVAVDLRDVEKSLTTRIDAVATDTTELKVAVARIEGPPRHLILASR